jgi:2-amino-4-hydroxy-6-hydroxymethyldihydropteridine diphosphokinase
MIQSTPLTVPHPRLHLRAFVLKPLLDLDPDIVVPGLGPARDFLNGVADQRIELLDTTAEP